MILRLTAALSLVIGIVGLGSFFQWAGEAPWSSGDERHLRQVKERTTVPERIVPFTFADFVALPHGRPLAEFAPLEERGVSLEGYMFVASVSSDGDYHLSLADSAWTTWPGDGKTITAEITPQFLRGSTNWSFEALSAALKPLTWYGSWPGGPSKVRISGWLMYDYQYDAPFVKQKAGLLPNSPVSGRLTGWEIHPVTRIEVWDDSLAAFVEYPR
jgi:hypothetical protein